MLLGKILRQQGLCSDTDLLDALDKQRTGDNRNVGEILIDMKILNKEQLGQALQVQSDKTEP